MQQQQSRIDAKILIIAAEDCMTKFRLDRNCHPCTWPMIIPREHGQKTRGHHHNKQTLEADL